MSWLIGATRVARVVRTLALAVGSVLAGELGEPVAGLVELLRALFG